VNVEDAHTESATKAGYTPEGARAARNCIIGHGDRSMISAMQMHLATLYHRTRPLQPGLMKTAMVFHEGSFLFDVFTHRGGPMKDALLVFPPHGMRRVECQFHPEGESPMPVKAEEANSNRLGTAIAVFSEPLHLATSLPAEPKIRLTDVVRRKKRDRGLVAAHVYFPGSPPSERAGPSNRGCVAMIPKIALRPKRRYLAFLEMVLPDGRAFSYSWWFETRARR
jgi:hypothetical protein